MILLENKDYWSNLVRCSNQTNWVVEVEVMEVLIIMHFIQCCMEVMVMVSIEGVVEAKMKAGINQRRRDLI
jgi:hypothetical protein